MAGLLNKRTLRTLYKCFIALPPFNRYSMPAPHKVFFGVTSNADIHGQFSPDGMLIEIHEDRKTLKQMCEVLHHEMIHVYYYWNNKNSNDYEKHDERFDKFAIEICKLYGYSRRSF